MIQAVVEPTDTRCRCGSLLAEDLSFAAQAEHYGIRTRMFRCMAGHTLYRDANPPPPPTSTHHRVPTPIRDRSRRCRTCQEKFLPETGRQWICPACRVRQRCTSCQRPLPDHTKSCWWATHTRRPRPL